MIHTTNSAAASERCSFQLSYSRAEIARRISPGFLDNDAIDDAYDESRTSAGEWEGDVPDGHHQADREPAVDAYIDSYAAMAIAEAIHEALEWFRVDGKPWLDPHGEHEAVIHELSAEFARKLASLRRGERPVITS